MDPNKEKLIEIFRQKVKGKVPNINGRNVRHDGRKGNWLEEQFGKSPDADNHADFWGYELKSNTTSKTTFGDWSANRYIYRDGAYSCLFDGKNSYEKKIRSASFSALLILKKTTDIHGQDVLYPK